MAKNITLEILIAKKQQSENDKNESGVNSNSEVLGGTIEVVKHKARDVIKNYG